MARLPNGNQPAKGHNNGPRAPSTIDSKECKENLIHHAQSGDYGAAEVYFKILVKEAKIRPNRSFFHGFIELCAQKQATNAAVWAGVQMVRAGIRPTIITLNVLIDACAKGKNLMMANSMWDLMTDLGLRPTRVTYNTILTACAQAADGAQAEDWLRHMLDAGISPCIVSYSTVISTFAKKGETGKLDEWFWHMQKHGVEPNRMLLNIMINACAKAENPSRAEFWFSIMESRQIKPDQKTFNSLIHASAKVGNCENVARWLTVMEQEGLQPDNVTFSSVIHSCAKAGNVKQAERWLNRMISMGIYPNRVCYNTVLHAYANVADVQGACRWLQKMGGIGFWPNKVTFNCMIDAYAKVGAASESQMWLDKMIKQGCHPDEHTRGSLARSSTFHGISITSDRAQAWAYEAVILAYAKHGQTEHAQRWLSKMVTAGLAPSADAKKLFSNQAPSAASRAIREELTTAGNSGAGAIDTPSQKSSYATHHREGYSMAVGRVGDKHGVGQALRSEVTRSSTAGQGQQGTAQAIPQPNPAKCGSVLGERSRSAENMSSSASAMLEACSLALERSCLRIISTMSACSLSVPQQQQLVGVALRQKCAPSLAELVLEHSVPWQPHETSVPLAKLCHPAKQPLCQNELSRSHLQRWNGLDVISLASSKAKS